MNDDDVKKFLAERKAEGLKIDPAVAEVDFIYAQVLDPYGIYPDLPEECDCIGREYFVRNPGSNIWVNFGDLPEATCDALQAKWDKAYRAGWKTICAINRGDADEDDVLLRLRALRQEVQFDQ